MATPDYRDIQFARWMFEQQRNAEVDMVNPNFNNTRHQSPPVIVINDDDDEDGGGGGGGGRVSLRSVQTSGAGKKRKIYNNANDDDDGGSSIIVCRPLPSGIVSSRGRQQDREVIDLTLDDSPPRGPKRQRNTRWMDRNVEDESSDELRWQVHVLLGEGVGRPHPIPRAPVPPPLPPPPPAPEEEMQPVVVPKDYFHALPLEIRSKIYRLLLVSPKPIPVKDLWQEVIRTSTRRTTRRPAAGPRPSRTTTRVPAMGEEPSPDFSLDPRILRVNKQSFHEGRFVLYGENTFYYLLRDPSAAAPRTGGNRPRARRTDNNNNNRINWGIYGHLIRNLEIEMERNRTGPEYQNLIRTALEKLVYGGTGVRLRRLTLTVSPLYESGEGGDGEDSGEQQQQQQQQGGKVLSVVGLFDKTNPMMRALKGIEVDWLRVCVNVNSHLLGGEEENGGNDQQVDGEGNVVAKPRKWHLEMTLDLRWLARYMERLKKEGPVGGLWENDAIVKAARAERGRAAAENLGRLRRLIEEACETPEYVVRRGTRDGLWRTAEEAEVKRLAERRRMEKKFEMDGYDDLDPSRKDVTELRRKIRKAEEDRDEEEDSGDEGRDGAEDNDEGSDSDDDDEGEEVELKNLPLSRKLKSLVISIDKVGNEWKCFRI
ncbi:hypothetical protein QBC36DRAFT_360335 [Triangularia setosa]|uniref:2EXR domain-containing protein n=1 Tax=Triangularia setosa TaxID=2587417 RepID=A0AAN7A4S7_9PEZI|nr:hypothetical protein QBC36DRAFT_360335 [Podospora setosa]